MWLRLDERGHNSVIPLRGQAIGHFKISCLLSALPIVDSQIAGLFVANLYWRARAVQREHAQFPFHGHGRWKKANRLVAGLILQLPCNWEDFAVFSKRTPELGTGTHFHILADAERYCDHRNLLLDRRQIECLG